MLSFLNNNEKLLSTHVNANISLHTKVTTSGEKSTAPMLAKAGTPKQRFLNIC